MKKRTGLATAMAATVAIGSGLFGGGKANQQQEQTHMPPLDEPDSVMQMVENTGEEINMEYIEPQQKTDQTEIFTLEEVEQSNLTDKLYEAQRLSELDIERDENGKISYDSFKNEEGQVPEEISERIAQLTYNEMTQSIEDEANQISTSGVLGISSDGVERHKANQKVYVYGYLEFAQEQSKVTNAPLGGELDTADYGPIETSDLGVSEEFIQDPQFLETLHSNIGQLEAELEEFYNNHPEPETDDEIKLQMYEDAAVKVAIAQEKGADLRMGNFEPDEIDIGR